MSSLDERLARMTPKQRALLELRLGRSRPPAGEIEPGPRGPGASPPSFSQKRLWFVDQMNESESLSYHISYAVLLRGRLLVPVLRRALEAVVDRHDALRTTFVEREGTPLQVVAAKSQTELPLVDLAGLPPAAREPVARELAVAVAEQPFSLTCGPLLRALLLRLGQGEHVLALVSHHIVSDAWSLVILVRDLTLIYLAFAAGRSVLLPALPLQYRDFAAWQRRFLSGATLDAERAYWRRKLLGVSSFVSLPTDRPRPAVQGFRGARERFALDAVVVTSLEELARRTESTLFMVFLAAYAALVRYHAAQDDIVISAPISYRNLRGCENLIGFFVNTLLLRVDLSGNPAFLELIARVRTLVLEAYDHQHLPLDLAIQEAAPERSRSYSPLLQLSLNFVHHDLAGAARSELGSAAGRAGAELAVEAFDFGFANAPTELGLVLFHRGETIEGLINYRAELLERGTVTAMIDQLLYLLEQAGRRPACRLSELDGLLAERDRRRRQTLQASLESSLAASLRQRRRRGVA
jgi:Condensation domain